MRKSKKPAKAKKPTRKPSKARKARKTRKLKVTGIITGRFVEPETVAPEPIRAQILNSARDLTLGSRNDSYGDPIDNFARLAAIRAAFWQGSDTEEMTSAWGSAMDAVMVKLARIASAPTEEAKLAVDTYKDLINYAAIAVEVANG